MLSLRTIKISPLFTNRTFGREFTVACGANYPPIMRNYTSLPGTNYNTKSKGNTGDVLAQNYTSIQPRITPFVLTVTRFNSSEHHPTSSKPTGWPEKPAGWPDKEQLERYEKYLFRTIAFIIDITRYSLLWAIRTFEKYVAKHPTVQYYWKQFMEKLENSRK